MATAWKSTERRTEAEQKEHEAQAELRRRRKAAKKSFEIRFPGHDMDWKNGALIFVNTGEAVPGSPTIAKPQRPQEPRPYFCRKPHDFVFLWV